MKLSYKPAQGDSGSLNYEFEELTLGDCDNIYTGRAEIHYEYDAADPDVGIMRGGFNHDVGLIWLRLPLDKPEWELPTDSAMYRAIADVLREDKKGYVENAILSAEEGSFDPDYWRD